MTTFFTLQKLHFNNIKKFIFRTTSFSNKINFSQKKKCKFALLLWITTSLPFVSEYKICSRFLTTYIDNVTLREFIGLSQNQWY